MNGIIRVKKDSRYFVASNEPFNDKALSWEARGVLGYLLSKPDNWVVRNTDLIKQGPAGREKIERILRELKDNGYLLRYRERDEETKRFTWVTEVYESPSLHPLIAIPGKAVDGSPVDGFPGDGSPVDGKAVDVVSTELPNTNLINTNGRSTEGGGHTPSAPSAASPSALDIYKSVTKIKKVDKIPEVVIDWLAEQEQYMAVAYHPEALRQAIKDADKEGQVFNVETLDYCFTDRIPEVTNVHFTKHGKNGKFTINFIDLSSGNKVPADSAPPWILKNATQMVEDHLKEKQEATA